jgi:hypothetical protein
VASIVPYLSMAGDQTIIVPNGTYTGGSVSSSSTPGIVHAATNGANKGFLVLVAETQGGVTIVPENTAVDTQSVLTITGAERILFVGFKHDGIVCNLFGTKYLWWWYGDFRYRGQDHPLYPSGANYGYSPTTFILGLGATGRGEHNRWYGCQFHDTEDDAFRMRQQNFPLWQGCTWTNIYHSQTNFNYHSDCIQFTGGITGAQILDYHMDTRGGTGFMCGVENTNPQSIDVEQRRGWMHGSFSYGAQYFIREEAVNAKITVLRERIQTWDTGGSPGNPGYTASSALAPGSSITVTNIASNTDVPVGTDPATAWRAVAGHAYGDWASFLNFAGTTPPPPPAPPTAPTALTVNAPISTSLEVQWTNGTGTVERSIVEYGTGGLFTQSVTVTGAGQSVTIAAAADTTYNVRVRHQNSSPTNGGFSPYSSTVTATTPSVVVPPVGPPSAQPSIVGSGPSGVSFLAATLTLTSRADVEVDDVLVAWIVGHSAALFPLGLPAGWDTVPDTTEYVPAATFGAQLVYKVAEAADVAVSEDTPVSYVFTHDGSTATSQSSGRIAVIRGADPADPFNVVGVTEYTSPASSLVSPPVVTDVDYTLFMAFIASDNGPVPVTVSSVGPAAFTELWDLAVAGGTFTTNSVWWVSGGIAGPKAAQTAVLNQAEEAVMVVVAFSPAGEWELPPLAGRIGLVGDNRISSTIALLG